MNSIIKLLFCFLIISSCEKKEDNIIVKENAFVEYLSLSNYTIESKEINDSITEIKGKNGNYTIAGNLKNKLKFGWWKVVDRNNDNEAKFEFLIIDEKESLNQYLLFRKKGDTAKSNSLFYTSKKDIKDRSITYHINFPAIEDTIINSKFYYIINDGTLQKVDVKKLEVFKYKLQIPKSADKSVIKGMFTIAMERNKVIGISNLYTSDTLFIR